MVACSTLKIQMKFLGYVSCEHKDSQLQNSTGNYILNITTNKNNDKHLRKLRDWTDSCPRLMVSVHFNSSNLKKYLYIAIDLTCRLYIAKYIAILKHAGHSKKCGKKIVI